MHQILTRAVLGIAALGVAGAALADLKPEEQIQYRQAGYSFMSWNMGKIKANLDGDFNSAQVAAAANVIAGIANSGMGALFGPGTDKDVGSVKTNVKPELFKNAEDVGTLAKNFTAAADTLAKVAAEGDEVDVSVAFGELGQTCKACHDKYRMKD